MDQNFVSTREAGLSRLAAFVPHAAGAYAAHRNNDLGPDDRSNVSVLSPYIRHRMITEREVCAAVLSRHSLPAPEKYIQEVLWRTYWKGWLELRPGLWRRYLDGLEAQTSAAAANSGLRRSVEAACEGRTGIEGFDDWARELVETGYLHNHARMWFASIWIFTLRLPWELGADFFLRHLLDGDPASNTLSWRWVAGLQTRGKSYLATRDNIARCTGGRFSPKGLATSAVPLDELPFEGPRPLPERVTSFAGGGALLLTEDDWGIETLPIAPERISVAAIMDLTALRTPDGVSPAVAAFCTGAADDAVARARHHLPSATVRNQVFTSADVADVLAWLRAAGVTSLTIPETPVGAAADAVDALAKTLSAQGIGVTRLRRSWDHAAWPQATKGFFPFKERIPELLRMEGVV